MNQQTPDRARQELRVIIGGIFDHVLRKEKENAIRIASRMEDKIDEKDVTSSYDSFGSGLGCMINFCRDSERHIRSAV